MAGNVRSGHSNRILKGFLGMPFLRLVAPTLDPGRLVVNGLQPTPGSKLISSGSSTEVFSSLFVGNLLGISWIKRPKVHEVLVRGLLLAQKAVVD